MIQKKLTLFSIFIFLGCKTIFSQSSDTTSFRLNSRYSFYNAGENGEMLLHIPDKQIFTNLKVMLMIEEREAYSFTGKPGNGILRLPFDNGLKTGNYKATVEIISRSTGKKYLASADLNILPYKSNEVKTDRLTGGLIVNGRPFFPFGFYCYSPVYPTLPEEEAVKGFNMISPYQKILPERYAERKAYMDRCAALGMKVHYNLLSVSGGGGVGSMINGMNDKQKKELLISEIKSFMDHPALLAWYVSDEPNGNGISPEKIKEIYNLVRKIDPWHPVSVVFTAPFSSAGDYEGSMDIVMADPYPVPDLPVSLVGNTAARIRKLYDGKAPVWIVPQAFGGGEIWKREPTAQEIRSMTYQAIINGARGIQYFVRQGFNSFPKSPVVWDECGRLAMEIAEITPWLLSDEKTTEVKTSSPDVSATTCVHNSQMIIMAVNKTNNPLRVDLRISGFATGEARELFENRQVKISEGTIRDFISGYGTHVYISEIKHPEELIKPYKGNLLKDPGFEDLSNPGIPTSCYAWNEGDRGATFFLDSREHLEGNHSLRLITPSDDKGTRLRFFPIRISEGRTYVISVWAKTDPEAAEADSSSIRPACFQLGLSDYGSTTFVPGKEWKQFVTFVTIPRDSVPSPKANVILRMPSRGVVWFDMIQAFEAVDILRSINPEITNE